MWPDYIVVPWSCIGNKGESSCNNHETQLYRDWKTGLSSRIIFLLTVPRRFLCCVNGSYEAFALLTGAGI